MEGGNINKKKRGRECGEDHGHVPMEKRSEMMTDSKELQYHHHDPLGFMESTDGLGSSYNNISGYIGECNLLYELIRDENPEEEKEKEVGVFDFPWLKEGGESMIFKGDDELCLQGMGVGSLEEDTFTFYSSCLPDSSNFPCSTASTSTSSLALHHNHAHDISSVQIPTPCLSPALPIFHDDHYHKFDQDNSLSFSSLQVDHADSSDQPTDCIWSSVLDQPLDINLSMI